VIGKFIKSLIVNEIAEWIHQIQEAVQNLHEEKKDPPIDESVSGFHTELEKPELLDGQVIADKRQFGFGINTKTIKDARQYNDTAE
jgi:hypothetical protein